MDYLRFPISQMHLGTFLDSLEFQIWTVDFKTEVCAKSAFLHITVHRIKEVETAKSIGCLMTSRSITGRRDFPDYEMPGAIIASAFKKPLINCVHFRKRVSVERAACPETRPILTKEADCFHDLWAFSSHGSF